MCASPEVLHSRPTWAGLPLESKALLMGLGLPLRPVPGLVGFGLACTGVCPAGWPAWATLGRKGLAPLVVCRWGVPAGDLGVAGRLELRWTARMRACAARMEWSRLRCSAQEALSSATGGGKSAPRKRRQAQGRVRGQARPAAAWLKWCAARGCGR